MNPTSEKILYFFSLILTWLNNLFKDPRSYSFKTILIVKMDEIGDMVYAAPVFEQLKKNYPNAKITVCCKANTSLLLNYNEYITDIIQHLPSQKKYDLIVDLRGNWRSFFYAIRKKPIVRLDRGTVRFKNKYSLAGHPHEIETNLAIIKPVLKSEYTCNLKISISHLEREKANDFLKINAVGEFILIHPFARKQLRKWDIKKYEQLICYFKKEKNWDTIVVGGLEDEKDVEQLQIDIPFKIFSTINEFNLIEFIGLVERAQLFIGNESGPLHIAAVTEIPTIGLFGPGVPNVFYPIGKRATYIHNVLSCNPCNQIHCVNPTNTCMDLIMINDVINKANELLWKK